MSTADPDNRPESVPGDAAPAAAAISPRRKILFRLVALFVLPVVILLVAELGLRLAGYGVSMRLTTTREVGGRASIVSNQHFMERFFAAEIARDILPFRLERRKGDRYRVFVLGGSAAQGDPEPAFGLARVVETMLRHHYPDADFEVVNLGVAAINSHVVLPMARDAAGLDPDLFIVYLGNNEVIGPFGAGTAFSPMLRNRAMIRARLALAGTRIGQLVKNIAGGRGGGSGEQPAEWAELGMFLERQVAADDARLETVYSHYRDNLRDICKAGRSAGAPVIVSTVAVNLGGCAPFASMHRQDLDDAERGRFEQAVERGAALRRDGNHAGAVDAFIEAAAIDAGHAGVQFRLGRALRDLGRHEEARACFVRARDLDTLRFRADERIHAIVRDVAGGHGDGDRGVYLVDSVERLDELAPQRIPGDEFLHEHVHLTYSGNYHIAAGVVATILELDPERLRRYRAAGAEALSEDECRRRMAFTTWNRREIEEGLIARMKRPPYTQQLNHEELLELRERRVARWTEALAAGEAVASRRAYEAAMAEGTPHWSLRFLFAQLLVGEFRDAAAAEEQLRLIIDSIPPHAAVLSSLGQVLLQQQRFDEAESAFRQALAIRDQTPERLMLATVLAAGGDRAAARVELQRLVDGPGFVEAAHIQLARLVFEDDRTDEAGVKRAIELCRRVLEHNPDSRAARVGIAEMFVALSGPPAEEGRPREARDYLLEAVAANPDNARAHFFLAGVLFGLDDRDGARRHLEEVLRIQPGNAEARTRLEQLR